MHIAKNVGRTSIEIFPLSAALVTLAVAVRFLLIYGSNEVIVSILAFVPVFMAGLIYLKVRENIRTSVYTPQQITEFGTMALSAQMHVDKTQLYASFGGMLLANYLLFTSIPDLATKDPSTFFLVYIKMTGLLFANVLLIEWTQKNKSNINLLGWHMDKIKVKE